VLKLVPDEAEREAPIKGPSITPGYWRNPDLTRDAFDDEGVFCLGDALRFAVPDDPSKGFFFDGRVAENSKMSTGTWVGVGAWRPALTNALQGLARNVVVAGGEALSDADLFAHPDLRVRVAALLADYNATAGDRRCGCPGR